jgi:hypothetical protein
MVEGPCALNRGSIRTDSALEGSVATIQSESQNRSIKSERVSVHRIVEELDIASWDFPTAAFLFRDLKDNAMLVCVGREGSLPGCGKILGVGGGGYERGEGAELKDAFSHQRILPQGFRQWMLGSGMVPNELLKRNRLVRGISLLFLPSPERIQGHGCRASRISTLE